MAASIAQARVSSILNEPNKATIYGCFSNTISRHDRHHRESRTLPSALKKTQFAIPPCFLKQFKGGILRSTRVMSTDIPNDFDMNGEAISDDFYSVLGLRPNATAEEIKKAYYSCMKSCHPDLGGDDPERTNFCIFINEVYEVLSDPEQRMVYDEIHGYTLTSVNPFQDSSLSADYTFVDEFDCIGCKNCANTAPLTFDIESEYGRARVTSQSGDQRMVQIAIETCPVNCIYRVTASQLALLEDEMRRVERVNVGMMLAGQGTQPPDVFAQASWRWERRQAKARERAKIRMMKEEPMNTNGNWWQGIWDESEPEKQKPVDPVAREKAERVAAAAAAARKWRDYSRNGADRRTIQTLPESTEAEVMRP